MLPHNYLHVQYKPNDKWIHCKARQPLEPSRVLSGVRSSCEPPSVWILTMVDWSDGGHCNGQFLCSFYVLNTEQTALMCTTSRLLLVLSVVSAACPMRPMPSSSVSQAAMIICCHVSSMTTFIWWPSPRLPPPASLILISVHRDVIIFVYSESLKHINFPNRIFDNMWELGGCSWKVLGVSYLGFVARRAAIWKLEDLLRHMATRPGMLFCSTQLPEL